MHEDPRTDEELVERAQASARDDLRAFESLVRRYQGQVVANCRHLTGSSLEADDLAQEVFVKAFYALTRFERRSAFKTWLFRIKVNHCLSHLAKRRGKTFVEIEEAAVAGHEALERPAEGERTVHRHETRGRIAWVLDQIPETLRVPLVLRDLDGLSYQEIADRLELGLSAVKMRIKRGRESFRELYGDPAEETQDDRRSVGSARATG